MEAGPHVAVVALGDPESPQTWSGTTAGVLLALRELGARAHAVDLTLPPGVEQTLLLAGAAPSRNRFDAQSASLTMRVRSRLAQLRVQNVALDGAVQVGTNFQLPAGLPYVTLEDMTVRQGLALHPVFSRMSPRGVAGWERRRAHVYARARVCTAASHWVADSLIADYGIAPERTAVVGLGANHLTDPGNEGRDWGTPQFLFVGLDWERKGGPILLRAFSDVRSAHPDATLDLVGGHPLVDQPGVVGHGVRSRANTDDRRLISELFSRATCLVMPSQVEPFGIVHIEAASAGIPSIGSSVGGPRDIIGEDGGLLVGPGDEQALARAMLHLCDPGIAYRAGLAARERARLFTWPKVAERLLRSLGLATADRRELAPPL